MQVETKRWRAVDPTTRDECARLWERVWPSGDTPDIEARLAKLETLTPDHESHFVHIARDASGQIVAVARTFEHRVGYQDQERTVIALAGVCSDLDRRGDGFGDAVVREAFERVDDLGWPALYQTPVPDFYERFGSRVIDNDITTSKPDAKSFDDDWAMIHPASTEWDDDVIIDLRADAW